MRADWRGQRLVRRAVGRRRAGDARRLPIGALSSRRGPCWTVRLTRLAALAQPDIIGTNRSSHYTRWRRNGVRPAIDISLDTSAELMCIGARATSGNPAPLLAALTRWR